LVGIAIDSIAIPANLEGINLRVVIGILV